ncbi:GNAT family N-acetyltransferase [Pseudarthrobacter sp. N5]|uniref:GNAT family N-acetyltransferase n=1 Tax=Pseudarthrobacter sp. N5 TaxID=3418416 RepID=UPI003CE68C15
MDNRMSVAGLEVLMDAAWPAPDRHDTGEWVLRSASGVTQRANSVWPRMESADTAAAAREAALWYRQRRLPVIYQIFDDVRHGALNALLDAQGFTRQSETLVMAKPASAGDVRAGIPRADASAVELLDQPSAEWLTLWWGINGRGGDPEREIARGILTGCPSLYALVRDDDGGAAAIGRLALVDGQGGLYCMATRPDARRRGHAARIIRVLLGEGAARGLAGYWLLVTVANTAARELYRAAGFVEAGRYVYRQARPTRALTGC